MSTGWAIGGADADLTREDLREALSGVLEYYDAGRVLAIPPDFTRYHSLSGMVTEVVWECLGDRLIDVLPALGTHRAMEPAEIARMFGAVPPSLFRDHDWRHDVVGLGEIPSETVRELSVGLFDLPWPAMVNRLVRDGGHDLIVSIGQVVPHEVAGMAGHAKNLFIGVGGSDGINRSHFLGAVYGMERIMGRAENPVRALLDIAASTFAEMLPRVLYVNTVVDRDDDGRSILRGVFISEERQGFTDAAELSAEVNIEHLDRAMSRAIVYLDPETYTSTWLGNKAIYRTRMALADGAELTVVAPGVRSFGEDHVVDGLIRRHGYHGREAALDAVRSDPALAANLGAAAHLIHGSSEGRFKIRYCPGHLSQSDVEGVGYLYGNPVESMERFRLSGLRDGWHCIDGEDMYTISNPGMGLWISGRSLP